MISRVYVKEAFAVMQPRDMFNPAMTPYERSVDNDFRDNVRAFNEWMPEEYEDDE